MQVIKHSWVIRSYLLRYLSIPPYIKVSILYLLSRIELAAHLENLEYFTLMCMERATTFPIAAIVPEKLIVYCKLCLSNTICKRGFVYFSFMHQVLDSCKKFLIQALRKRTQCSFFVQICMNK